MIEEVEIKKIATFDDTGIVIKNLKNVNFIYGANGSGKTTISKFLNKPQSGLFSHCSLRWENDIELKTLVYNKDFRDNNFGKGTIKGVFTLGQATKEEAEQIEQKRFNLKEIKDKGIQKKDTIEQQTTKKDDLELSFREDAWQSVYKKNEEIFKEAFKGVMQKKAFSIKLLNDYTNNISELMTKDELIEKAKIIYGKVPVKMEPIMDIDNIRINNIESNDIWNKKILGKSDVAIANLIQSLNLNDWVNEGRKYIQAEDNICPFCQQPTINNEFKEQIEKYFDTAFLNDITNMKSLSDEYIRTIDNILNDLQIIETNEKNKDNSKLDIEKFSARLKTMSSQVSVNKVIISSKAKEPSRAFTFTKTSEQFNEILQILKTANQEIKIHNKIVNNYTTEKIKLTDSIWKFLAEDFKSQIQRYNKEFSGLTKGIENLAKEKITLLTGYQTLDNEIKELTKNLTSIQPSIDEINNTLDSFGFNNFKIVPARIGVNQYQIHRENGELAESTLSEGEITFITFLYFLQLTKGSIDKTTITDDRIVVVDDPISSLDSNVLFIVSTLLKGVIKSIKSGIGNIKQIILFTHNVYFHKEISFIDGRTRNCSKTNFWILRKSNETSSIQDYVTNNPIQNSYDLLWQELKIRDDRSCISIQNLMRRIIENYFKILGKYGDDDLISKFSNPQEKEICRSLISWINDGSHSIPDDLYVEQQDGLVDKYFEVFKTVFEKTNHIEHYNMMMK